MSEVGNGHARFEDLRDEVHAIAARIKALEETDALHGRQLALMGLRLNGIRSSLHRIEKMFSLPAIVSYIAAVSGLTSVVMSALDSLRH